MWIETSEGLVNLAHAFEVFYDETKKILSVWWAFPLPGYSEETVAGNYNSERLHRYTVEPDEWGHFKTRARRS